MQGTWAREMGNGRRSPLGVALSSVVLGFCFVGCAESAPPPAEGEEERSGQAASSGGETSGAAPAHHPAGTTTADTNPFAVPADASDALRQAEWLREEQSRAYRVLELEIEREGTSCDAARSTSAEICDLSDRICAQADTDRAAAPRCDDSMQRCGASRRLVQPICSG